MTNSMINDKFLVDVIKEYHHPLFIKEWVTKQIKINEKERNLKIWKYNTYLGAADEYGYSEYDDIMRSGTDEEIDDFLRNLEFYENEITELEKEKLEDDKILEYFDQCK